jgi:hypothetical protein
MIKLFAKMELFLKNAIFSAKIFFLSQHRFWGRFCEHYFCDFHQISAKNWLKKQQRSDYFSSQNM